MHVNFFTARRHASAAYSAAYAVVVSVSLSVCLSVASRCSTETAKRYKQRGTIAQGLLVF